MAREDRHRVLVEPGRIEVFTVLAQCHGGHDRQSRFPGRSVGETGQDQTAVGRVTVEDHEVALGCCRHVEMRAVGTDRDIDGSVQLADASGAVPQRIEKPH